MTKWTCLIRPFYDRLDVELPFVFYPVADDAPFGPATVFTDRFWDDREHWSPGGVGVVPFSMKPYFGPVPDPGLGEIEGTDEQWANGFSYATWLAGGYSGTCWPIVAANFIQLHQVQDFLLVNPVEIFLDQVQGFSVNEASGLIAERQEILAEYHQAFLHQVQEILAHYPQAQLHQVQNILAHYPQAQLHQVQEILAHYPQAQLHQVQEILAHYPQAQLHQVQQIEVAPDSGDSAQIQDIFMTVPGGFFDQVQNVGISGQVNAIEEKQECTVVVVPQASLRNLPWTFNGQVGFNFFTTPPYTISFGPTPVLAGVVVVVVVSVYSSGGTRPSLTVTDTRGTVLGLQAESSNSGQTVWNFVYAGTTPSTGVDAVTIAGATFIAGAIYRLSGSGGTTGLLDQNNNASGIGTAANSGNITTSVGNAFYFGVVGWYQGPSTISAIGSFLSAFNSPASAGTMGVNIQFAGSIGGQPAGTYNSHGTISSSQSWSALVCDFK